MDIASNLKYSREAVAVSRDALEQSSVPFEVLEEAFGPDSLGILIVRDLPARFLELRLKLLSYGSYLANLPAEELETLSCPEASYLTGWSHGREALKSGSYDTFKGSYYVNCAFYQGRDITVTPSTDFASFTAPNVWPDEDSLPGFQDTFEELCNLIIDTAVLVARACDRYGIAKIDGYEIGYLERVVTKSTITKARLLHYFPSTLSLHDRSTCGNVGPPSHASPDRDSWCATHIDHGCLTGLTSAIYIDEFTAPPEPLRKSSRTAGRSLPNLPNLSFPPDVEAGLYIHARDSTITKVSIPYDCLGFQTGEALQVITRGKFKAVPHFVRAPLQLGSTNEMVARNTLAVFTQPNLEDIVDREKGTTFGEFSKEVLGRFG